MSHVWFNVRKNCNEKRRTLDIKSKRTKSSLVNRLCQLLTYQISLRYFYCSKQKLTSCVILIIPNFLARFVQKMSMTKIKLFSVTYVNFGFILNVTTLIIQITGIFKTVMNPSIAQNVPAQFFLSIPYLATKTSWLVLKLIATSHSGNTQKMIQFIIIKTLFKFRTFGKPVQQCYPRKWL